MKKNLVKAISIICLTGVLVGCSAPTGQSAEPDKAKPGFNTAKQITVVSREDGSGTRGAFIELMGIEVKGDNGSRKDTTTKEAVIANKTDVMMTNISGDPYAIGYVSLGSLNDTVKPLKIDGITPSAENIKNGTYKVARLFNIATTGSESDVTKDFIGFILAKEGQDIVAKSYIAIDEEAAPYSGTKPAGKVVVAGSSSVAPIMEKLKEGYEKLNINASIEIQQSDSTAGMTGAINGTCDIGMSSRELKEKEKETLTDIKIALDGIVVIVNDENTIENITKDQVKGIFTGEALKWNEIE